MAEQVSEEAQNFIYKVLAEGIHYGWEEYGEGASDLFVGVDYPLSVLARKATVAAGALTVAENEFMAEARRLGYDTEAG